MTDARNERVQAPGMSAEVTIGGVVGVLIMAGVYVILFAANDNVPGGPDDDDWWDDLFNPPWAPG